MSEHIQVYNPIGGQPYSTAPTPKTSSGTIDVGDSSNKIATTEWVHSNIDKIAGKNVGVEWHSFTGKIPAGGVPYCGQEVLRATYSDLWNYVQEQGLVKTESEWQTLSTSQNGNIPFYSSGDGSTTFRMPKVVGYIKGATNAELFGVYAYGELTVTGSTTTDALASSVASVEAELANVESGLENKLDNGTIHIVETWKSDASWYRKYSDGWIEQGGLMSTSNTVTFHVAFSNTNYYVDVTWNGGKSEVFYPSDWQITKSSNTYFTTTATTNAHNVRGLCWYACGY